MKEQKCRTSENFVVQDVKPSKDGVHIAFENTELVLDSSSYTDLFLYPGKEIDGEEFARLSLLSERKSAIDYVSRILSGRRYTYQQVADKVGTKFRLGKKEIDEILSPYVESGILNDQAFLSDYIQQGLDSGYCFPYLEHRLIEKGISRELFSSLDKNGFDTDEEGTILRFVSQFDRRKKQYPLRKRKADILTLLLQRGFDSALSRQLIETFYSSLEEEEKERDEENESLLLKKRVKECYNSLRNKGLSPKALREKMIQRLVSKGFVYDCVVEEMDKEGF